MTTTAANRPTSRRTAGLIATALLALPFTTLASDWFQTSASGMEDVAAGRDGSLWLAGENGTVWVSPDAGQSFKQVEASGFARIAVAPDGVVWAAGSNGTLWKLDRGRWTKTSASGIGVDFGVTEDAPDVRVAFRAPFRW